MHLKLKLPNESSDDLWGNSRMFSTAVNSFLGSLNLIEALAQIANPENKNVTANRRRLGQSVINRTIEMASSLACYASMTGDQILSAKVSLSPAMVARSWDPVISATARSIYDLSEELIASGTQEAALCGITAEKNQLLLNSIVAFSASIGSEIGTTTSEPFSLAAELRRADEILRRGIDPLMLSIKAQNNSFFAGFRLARGLAEFPPQPA